MTKKISVGILGASGYGGAELLRRLLRHPYVNISAVASRQFINQPLAACWPQLTNIQPKLYFSSVEETINSCEVLFSAAPHGSATSVIKQALKQGKKIIDLSADFRLAPVDFATWYGQENPHPEIYQEAIYGLSEFHYEEVQAATLVANPGCYPTSSALALAPLAANNLLGNEVIINAASGVSGAGRSTKLDTLFSELNENFKPYSVAGTHRHTAEIENTLGRLKVMGKKLKTHSSFTPVTISFNPHLVPMTRGILTTCYTKPTESINNQKLLSLYQDFYQGFYQNESLIYVQEDLPQTKAVYGTDNCVLSVRFDERAKLIVVMAVIDNLGKGAAGQAVQNFNIMHNFEQTLSLQAQAVWP